MVIPAINKTIMRTNISQSVHINAAPRVSGEPWSNNLVLKTQEEQKRPTNR